MKFSSCSSKKKIGKGVTKNRENVLTVVRAIHKSTQPGYYSSENRRRPSRARYEGQSAPSTPALTEALLGSQPHKQERALRGGTHLSLSAGNMMDHVSKKFPRIHKTNNQPNTTKQDAQGKKDQHTEANYQSLTVTPVIPAIGRGPGNFGFKPCYFVYNTMRTFWGQGAEPGNCLLIDQQ